MLNKNMSKKNQDIIVTVLTPTYNRKKFIKRLYDSLLKQTSFQFQWLVIDDGSTDGTKNWFSSIKKKNLPFELDYIYKSNGGKHTALNYSHKYIIGDYLIIVDSDDYLTTDAISSIIAKWKKYENNKEIAEIIFQKAQSVDSVIKSEAISSLTDALNKGMKGDHCETIRSELFKQFLFPEFKGEKFVAEGAMWYRLAQGKLVVFINKIIYKGEYLAKGLTASGRRLRINNPRGGRWHSIPFLDNSFRLKIRIKNAILFSCYSFFIGDTLNKSVSLLNNNKSLVYICWLPGKLLYKYWKEKYV